VNTDKVAEISAFVAKVGPTGEMDIGIVLANSTRKGRRIRGDAGYLFSAVTHNKWSGSGDFWGDRV